MNKKNIIVYKTDQTQKLSLQKEPQTIMSDPQLTLTIDKNTTFQKLIGFGGSFTESACFNLFRINPVLRNIALKAYFGKDGIGYTIGRMPMGSCDFSLGSYAYIKDNDHTLESFNIKREFKYVIPTIKMAEELNLAPIKIMVSPWSPPPFMKSNKLFNYGGHLLKDYYDLYSDYYLKFLDELKKAKITVFALSTQNEVQAVQRWDSCIFTPEEERDFILTSLGPKLKQSIHHDLDLYILDHNRDIMLTNTYAIYNSKASEYVTGTAIHWYDNEPFENLLKHHELYPDKRIILSECCIEKQPIYSCYQDGERYGRNIIENLNNFCEAYIDWNLFLDETGGFNWVNNLCDAPVIINIREEKIIYQPAYYYIAHLSKFIKPGAIRIDLRVSEKILYQTAFKNPNGDIIVVVMNETNNDYPFKINYENEVDYYVSTKHSIMTIIIKEDADGSTKK